MVRGVPRYAIGGALVAWVLCADAASARQPLQLFKVSQDKAFKPALATLQVLVRTSKLPAPHHFCVVGYRGGPALYPHAWVYWPEENALVLWEPVTSDPARALVLTRRRLRLDKDVVATESDVRGSTFLVTKAWVKRTLRDCDAHGERFQVDVPQTR